MSHNLFIHSSSNGHLGCTHVLAIVNSAAVNIGVHVSFRIVNFSGYMLSSGIAESYGRSIPCFLRNLQRAFSRVETGMSGNFLSCSKGVKDPLEVPEVRCD